jgi:hypothetical protein
MIFILKKTVGSRVCEAYVQNNTPAAYRIFWCYGRKEKQITMIGIASTEGHI